MPIPLAGRKLNVSHSWVFSPTTQNCDAVLKAYKEPEWGDPCSPIIYFHRFPLKHASFLPMASLLQWFSTATKLLLGHREPLWNFLGPHQPTPTM